MPTPPDHRPAFAGARVDHFVLVMAAKWTDHTKTPPMHELYQVWYANAPEALFTHDIEDLFETFKEIRVLGFKQSDTEVHVPLLDFVDFKHKTIDLLRQCLDLL